MPGYGQDYANPAGGNMPPVEPPMPAGPPPAGAPAGPPGEASAQDVMGDQDQQRMAQIDAIAASAPQPEKPYTVKAVDKMLTAMNDFITSIDESIMPVEYAPPEGMKKIEGPLPAEVFVPFTVTMAFVEQLGEYEKYVIGPETLVSDTALKKAAANFGRMKKDKALAEDMQAAAQGAPPAEEEGPSPEEAAEAETGQPPGDFDQEDEEIMGMM